MKTTLCWWLFTVLLSGVSVLTLDTTGYPQSPDGHQVACPQGLSDCTVKDGFFWPNEGSEAVGGLEALAVLCCEPRGDCEPCLLVNVHLNGSGLLGEGEEVDDDGGRSGLRDEEDESVESDRSRTAHVMVCYTPAGLLTVYKRIEFTVTPRVLDETEVQLSLLVRDPNRVFFSSELTVAVGSLHREVHIPSVDEVCLSDLQERVKECGVPRLSAVIDQRRGSVTLEVEGGDVNSLPPSMCLQQERDGVCRNWTQKTIPLHSVTPCMCFQVWWDRADQRSRRSVRCLFRNHSARFQRNIWENVSVSVVRGQTNSGGAMLSWNLTAPCRLEAEAWLCQRTGRMWGYGCSETEGFRQCLSNYTWKENSRGHWQVPGAFQDVKPRTDLCMMVRVQGMDDNLGPFCPNVTSRWRWSLLLLIMVLISTAVLGFYFLREPMKRWMGKRHLKENVKRGYVVVLSPPDADVRVSEQVCELGSLLHAQGFGVGVDLWCRTELCSLGPLPWLHSQLQRLEARGGRALLVLNRSAWEKARGWGAEAGGEAEAEDEDEEEGRGAVRGSSPYSDVFSACLGCVRADSLRGRAGERFALVTFESHGVGPAAGGEKGVPELLQGLPWFHLPFQRQGLLSSLAEGGPGPGGGLRWWTKELKGGLSAGLQGFRRDSGGCLLGGLSWKCIAPNEEQKNKETGPL